MIEKLPHDFIKRIEEILEPNKLELFKKSYEGDFSPSLRVNSLKINPQDFFALFEKSPSNAIPFIEHAFKIERKSTYTKTPFYHSGLFYIQESSSMLPVEVLDPKPGEIILDSCASPGSKTTQIISKMENQGLLIANEIRRDRIGRLMENIIRWGAKNCIVTNQASTSFRPMLEFFDKILIDAPCSGEGMFRKDAEALSHWSVKNVMQCSLVQKNILRDLIPTLKVGGSLVYSTCTMAPEENEENLNWILKTYPNCFEIEEIKAFNVGSNGLISFQDKQYDTAVTRSRRIWPYDWEGEGFFVAKIKKIKSVPVTETYPQAKYNKAFFKKPSSHLNSFFKQLNFDKNYTKNCFQIGYKIFSKANLLFEEVKDYLSLLKPVYLGVHVGVEKKGRVEPAHALALALTQEELKNAPTAEIDLDLSVSYLRGNELSVSKLDCKEGPVILTHKGFALGWARYKQNKLKNLFPKSMRNKL